MKYKTSPKYCYLIYNRKGELVAKGCMEQILNEIEESEFSIRNAYYKKAMTKYGHTVDRVKIDYYAQEWDIVDDDDKVIFTGKTPDINEHFGYKHVNVEYSYAHKSRLGGKYRIFKHGEYISPSVSKETQTIAEMLLIKDITCAGGKHIERTISELEKLGIEVDVEPSLIFKGDYVLYRRS